MAERYNPQNVLLPGWRDYLYEKRDELFILPCVEGDLTMNGRWLLVNMILCMPLINRYRPISQNHLHLDGIYDAKTHAHALTKISRTLEDYGYSREDLGHDMIMTVMNMHNLCYTHLPSHVRTIDIFSMADTLLQDDVKPVVTADYGDITDRNIKRMEKEFKRRSEEVDKLLSNKPHNVMVDGQLSLNIFRAPLMCGALKKGQFFQFVYSAGPKTDTDDDMFLRPVRGSFLSGMYDEKDLCIESRSAAKSSHYNKTQMSATQYNNRKLHILASVFRFLYHNTDGTMHDCGSNVYMSYEPNKRTVKYYKGKFYLDALGNLVELTPERYDDVVGRTIKMRDVQGCRYTDGYCETCGGTLTKSFSRQGNLGFMSNVNVGAPVAQQVLSTKHLTSTDAVEYRVPEEIGDYLLSEENNIFLRQAMKAKKNILAFGFQLKDVYKINDLKHLLTESELHPAYFSDIKFIYKGRLRDDGRIQKGPSRVSMKDSNNSKLYPHLSPEILGVIRDHRDDLIVQDGIAWLLMRHVDVDAPIMQCRVVNNSIRRFVDAFTSLVTKQVERYSSMNHFMRDLTKLLWPRVEPHITHVSCLARACMVTDKKNFEVPVMDDPDRVMFRSLNRIIPMRSIGGLFAYQGVDAATNKSLTYMTPKLTGTFDMFMGYADTIEDLKNVPVVTGSRVEEELKQTP